MSIFIKYKVFFPNSKYFSEISRIKKYMNSSICALGGMHQKNFEMSNFKNVEKMHKKLHRLFYISKKMK